MADYQISHHDALLSHDFRQQPQSDKTPDNMGKEKTSFCVVKYIFFGFNVFLWLVGCGLLAVAIWLWGSQGPTVSVIPTYSYLSASSLGIVVAIMILAIGFMGCFGAFMENQCLLIGYFILVLLVFAIEIAAGTLALVNKEKVKGIVYKELIGGIRYDYRTELQVELADGNSSLMDRDSQGWSVMLDQVQRDLRCCGVNNHSDWFHVRAWPDLKRVPDSCCKEPKKDCGRNKDPKKWFEPGCLEEIEYWFTHNMYVLGVTGVTVGCVQILAMVAAIAQFCYIRSKRFPM